jgi:phenylpyruvate tautomerase PptA (4-oxalocrotonate tautomerase family)
MATALKGGSSRPPGFTNSMAAAIEDELNALLTSDGKVALPGADTAEARDRRRFVAAIARGVVRHLKENPDALEVVFTQVASPHSTGEFKAHVRVNASDVP